MSQVEEEPKAKDNWTENDLREAIRRINAGEINFKEAESTYGISPRTIHRQRAIENMRAQLNPEKTKKLKNANSSAPKKDVTILRKPVEISCSSLGDVVGLLNTGTEEVKQLLNRECDLIYECKVCKNLFRSLANFISHKRIYCCELYSAIHTRTDEVNNVNDDESELINEERLKEKENIKEFTAKPFRVTCKKDLTAVLKRITTMADLLPADPILHLQTLESAPCAFQQVLFTNENDIIPPFKSITNEKQENKEALSKVELEKDKTVTVDKNQEKCEKGSLNSEKHFVAEKRFRCPVCLSNFTIKRSVLRHLKSVHHKSVEQVEKLKSRIQVHFVRIKNNSSETSKEKDDTNAGNSSTKSEHCQDEKYEKECASCGRTFTHKNTYISHIKSCRRSSNRSDTSNESSPKKTLSLVPVISLTPINTGSYSSRSDSEDNTGEPSPSSKKVNSKKVNLPLTTSSNSQSKKIGIQVRMNYCKDTQSAPNSANVTPTYAASSQSSGDNSRRNSMLSVIGCDDIPKSHNTRSNSKLANILENLCDKKKSDRTAVNQTELQRKTDPNDVSIYCNSCRKIYVFDNFNCEATSESIIRWYKCALRDCDFRTTYVDELIPHLSSSHPVLSENELTNVKAVFFAEFLDENGLDSLGDCKRRPAYQEKLEPGKNKKKLINNDKHDSTNGPSEQTWQNSSNKRKLQNTTKVIMKKKPAIDKDATKNDVIKTNDIENQESTSNNIKDYSKLIDKIEDIKIECEEDMHCDSVEAKKLKKTEDDCKDLCQKVKQSINILSLAPSLVNGAVGSSSSDEENDRTQVNPKIKINHSKNIRKPNLPFNDPKSCKTASQRINLNNFHNDMSPSPSTPDSDLDQPMMCDETLQKSIMTIIFGKDMSAEKVEENVCNRDKSPSSSSSDGGKEKRYSFRIARQTTQVKSVVQVENKQRR